MKSSYYYFPITLFDIRPEFQEVRKFIFWKKNYFYNTKKFNEFFCLFLLFFSQHPITSLQSFLRPSYNNLDLWTHKILDDSNEVFKFVFSFETKISQTNWFKARQKVAILFLWLLCKKCWYFTACFGLQL